MNLDRTLALAFLIEKKRRFDLKHQIIKALDLNFSREEKSIVKRGVVYSAISNLTKCNNNNHFKKTVRLILQELGIKAICTHKNYLFKGIANEHSAELRRSITLANTQQVARARAKFRTQ